jgi:hypothetical protein
VLTDICILFGELITHLISSLKATTSIFVYNIDVIFVNINETKKFPKRRVYNLLCGIQDCIHNRPIGIKITCLHHVSCYM